MAKQLSAYSPSRRRYPWAEWSKVGTAWQVFPGEDFDCGIKQFRTALRVYACRNGLGVSCTVKSVRRNGDKAPAVEFEFRKLNRKRKQTTK